MSTRRGYRHEPTEGGRGSLPADGHLAIDLDGGAAEVWRQCADVLYGSRPRPPADA
ncbi:hypothetical protein GA0115259_109095, partial [Streptomyces sp. MnatMP-M17]